MRRRTPGTASTFAGSVTKPAASAAMQTAARPPDQPSARRLRAALPIRAAGSAARATVTRLRPNGPHQARDCAAPGNSAQTAAARFHGNPVRMAPRTHSSAAQAAASASTRRTPPPGTARHAIPVATAVVAARTALRPNTLKGIIQVNRPGSTATASAIQTASARAAPATEPVHMRPFGRRPVSRAPSMAAARAASGNPASPAASSRSPASAPGTSITTGRPSQ